MCLWHRVRVEFLAGRLLLAFYSSFRWTPTFSVLPGFRGLAFSVLLEMAIDAARDVPATLHHNLGAPSFTLALFSSTLTFPLPPVMLPNSSTGKRLQPTRPALSAHATSHMRVEVSANKLRKAGRPHLRLVSRMGPGGSYGPRGPRGGSYGSVTFNNG